MKPTEPSITLVFELMSAADELSADFPEIAETCLGAAGLIIGWGTQKYGPEWFGELVGPMGDEAFKAAWNHYVNGPLNTHE